MSLLARLSDLIIADGERWVIRRQLSWHKAHPCLSSRAPCRRLPNPLPHRFPSFPRLIRSISCLRPHSSCWGKCSRMVCRSSERIFIARERKPRARWISDGDSVPKGKFSSHCENKRQLSKNSWNNPTWSSLTTLTLYRNPSASTLVKSCLRKDFSFQQQFTVDFTSIHTSRQ